MEAIGNGQMNQKIPNDWKEVLIGIPWTVVAKVAKYL